MLEEIEKELEIQKALGTIPEGSAVKFCVKCKEFTIFIPSEDLNALVEILGRLPYESYYECIKCGNLIKDDDRE